MANYFTTVFGSGVAPVLSLIGVNKGADIYLRVSGVEGYTLRPSEKVKAFVAPHSTPVASGTAINYLRQSSPTNDDLNGYYFFQGGENNTSIDTGLSYSDLQIPTSWENTEFDLYWLYSLGISEIYGSNLTGTYVLPHNIQSSEIIISGNLLSNNVMDYCIRLDGILNDTDSNYGVTPTDGPYSLFVKHTYYDITPVSGFASTKYYDNTILTSGINFQLPFFDERNTNNELSATYNFVIGYVSASSDKVGCQPIEIVLDQGKLKDNTEYFKNLDSIVFSKPDDNKLKKVGELAIPAGTIDRKRLSIGINDIAIKENIYVKQGTYVSSYYPIDFQAYTFALKVKEYIPKYDKLDPYDLIKYYVEFNNNTWERISPLERKTEYEQGILVPKMFVFDKSSDETGSENVKFLNFGSTITSFRIKITFNLNDVAGNKFPPPEVRDYKCLLFDKSQFFNYEG